MRLSTLGKYIKLKAADKFPIITYKNHRTDLYLLLELLSVRMQQLQIILLDWSFMISLLYAMPIP